MRSFLLLALLATAVTALPSEVPPVPAVEAPETAFTEEAAFDTAEAFSHAQDLVEKKGASACADLADATIKEVKSNIEQEQQLLNKIDKGDKCPQEGQDSVTAAKKALKDAEAAKVVADKALKDAQGAKVNFGDFTFSSLTPGNCQAMFGSSAYTSAKAKVDSAKKAAEKAVGVVTGSKTAVDNAVTAAALAVKTCQCNAYKAHEQALENANVKAEKANKAAWTKGYHLKCVLAGTAASSCSVPSIPKVKAVSLAQGVEKNACGGFSIDPTGSNKASFPIAFKGGTAPQSYSQSALSVSVSGDYKTGYTIKSSHPNVDNWYRGWYGPWKINKADLPVTLQFTYDPSGYSTSSNNHAYTWVGFDYPPNNGVKPHYDCTLDITLRLQPGNRLKNNHGCSYKDSSCYVQTNGKPATYEIRLAKDGTATSYMNGKSCGGFHQGAKATQFPLYVDNALYGGKAVIRNMKLIKGK